jgi:hypothetical protein
MKRYLIPFLVAFSIASNCHAFQLIAARVAAGGACTAPTCPTTCLMSATEGFEGGSSSCGTGDSTCNEVWVVSGSPTITDCPGTPDDNTACSKAMRFNASESDVYAYWDNGSAVARGSNNLDYDLYFYIDSASLDNYQTVTIANWSGSSGSPNGNYTVELELQYDSANYQIRAVGADNQWLTIALDTWYKVRAHGDTTAANSTISIDDGTTDGTDFDTFTRNDAADGQYLFIGACSGVGAGESLDIYFGYASVSTP